jgi:hypothetical protein
LLGRQIDPGSPHLLCTALLPCGLQHFADPIDDSWVLIEIEDELLSAADDAEVGAAVCA